MISENLATVMKLPLVIIFGVALPFYYLGVAFFAGIAVLLAAFLVNLKISSLSANTQMTLMKF